MKASMPALQLEYLREYPLGSRPESQRRNVLLRVGRVKDLHDRLDCFAVSHFAWKLARSLEGRSHVSDSEGTWPINNWRCEKRYGVPGIDVFPFDTALHQATSEVLSEAREMRRLCYFRAATAAEAMGVLATGHSVRYATEVTSEWYDPPAGTLVVPEVTAPVLGSHAVPLSHVDYSKGSYFIFRNSWGREWGFMGHGAISPEHFDRFIIEAWVDASLGLFVPYRADSGVICLEWKYSLTDSIGVHGREIVDAATSDRLAWTFCSRRDGFLDVEEFFVWPSERGKGYGRVLAEMVKRLGQATNLPLRMLVSHADSEPENLDNLRAAGRLTGVHYFESGMRWVHLIGTSTQPSSKGSCRQRRPQRPAFVLEFLRPRDEKPIDVPIEYNVVFGTNRRLLNAADRSVGFSSQRGDSLITGSAAITIPRTHQFGAKGRAWMQWWDWLVGKYPKIKERRLFGDESAFTEAVSCLIDSQENRKHNLLYVHGYNVTFENALLQAAQFGVDLKIPGATFVYSWPSAGGMKHYIADEATIEASVPYLQEYVDLILRQTADVPLNIIVHSMGNRAVLRMLESLAQQGALADRRIGNVILAAPDVDVDVFKHAIRRVMAVPSRTTLYAARGDWAVQASEWAHEYARAGLAPPIVTMAGMDTILVEGFNLLDLGHGYYSGASALLHDMFILLNYTLEPQFRPALIAAETLSGEPFWKLHL